MPKLIEQLRAMAAHGSAQDKADAIKVIDEQIEMTMAEVQDAAPHLVGHTEAYREMWTAKVEKLRGYVADLEEVRDLLSE